MQRPNEATATAAPPAIPSSPLAPMQTGMLFQSLLSADAEGRSREGYDIEQLHVTLTEAVDVAAFEHAWQLMLERHPALTASFHWSGLERPEQRFDPSVKLRVQSQQLDGSLESFLQRDRRAGFDLTTAPLMRVHVFPRGAGHTDIVWTFHHLLLDGRSIATVTEDVFAAYDALKAKRSPSLPPAPPPFSEYLGWLKGQCLEAGRAFFRRTLEGKTVPTALPLAEPSARPLPFEGLREHRATFAAKVKEDVHALAAEAQVTVGTVIEAAWALVLSRLTADDDVLFGVTRSCRRTALGGAAEPMVGLLINSFPSRVPVKDSMTVRELLASVRAQTVERRGFEHLPLSELSALSQLPHGAPLFETLLMFENRELISSLRRKDANWNEREARLYEQPSPPLTVTVFDDAKLEAHFFYDTRRHRSSSVARIGACFERALESLAANVDAPLAKVEILPRAEWKKIVHAWNDTARDFPKEALLHTGFEAHVQTQPDAVALEQVGRDGIVQRMSYVELDARANRLAHVLVARGAKSGGYVGICLDRTPELVVALLAVAKSGAAYVPLDPSYPDDRLAFMLEDTAASLVVTEQQYAAKFEGKAPCLVVDGSDGAEVARASSTTLGRRSAPEDVCYIIFTSGSTGRPKGVVLNHRAVSNTVDWVNRTQKVVPGDRLLFVTSPCFDLSVYDVFGTLAAGATVVIASTAQLKDAEVLAALITDARISIWDSAPASLQRLVPFFPKASEKTKHLRAVMLSGDWIPLSLPPAVREAFPRASVLSLGGATEAAIWSNSFPVGELDPRWTSVPYGKPIQNARYHVLDARLQPCPVGVPGELFIGGECLALGYLHRPELTAERFIADPFSSTPGERLYRTGDLARYFEDGNLEFLGRADFQVKIRGFRVELGEVEALLATHPSVRENLCVAVKDASGHNALVAYVVPNAGAAQDDAALKRFVGSKLPDFMVPSTLVWLDAMPLSSNGKVDRKALPSPSAVSQGDVSRVAPRTDEERQMVALWAEVLGKSEVGVHDDFFALGGHSLLAVNLVVRIKQQTGLDVPLSAVLGQPTVEGLLSAVHARSKPTGATNSAHGAPVTPHLVTLNRSGTKTPLVLVSGMGGFGFVFQGLARELGPDRPLHVLHAVGAENAGEGYSHSIEELASIYEPEILAACPKGPLALGGYSFGVLVAFELVSRLRRRGRDVVMLISFDGFAPGFPERLPAGPRLRAHAQALLTEGAESRRTYLRTRYANVKGRLARALGRPESVVEVAAEPMADAETEARLRHVAAGLWRARDAYRPARVENVPLLLIKSMKPDIWVGCRYDAVDYGWSTFIDGPFQTFTVRGEHLTLFSSTNAPTLAHGVSAALDEFSKAARSRVPENRFA